MTDTEPNGNAPQTRIGRLFDFFFPKRTRLERIKARVLRNFLIVTLLVGGADTWGAFLSGIDAVEVTSDVVRVFLEAASSVEREDGVRILAVVAAFFFLETLINFVAELYGNRNRPS